MPVDEQFLVLSALGPDRVGLVAELTDYLTGRGANVEDSRMVILGAEFGIMILVSGPEAAIARVEADRGKLETQTAMSVVTRRTHDPAEHRAKLAGLPCQLVAESLDRQGIVQVIAAELHRHGINIVALETTAYNAPISGSPLFRMEALIDVPRQLRLPVLREALDKLSAAENVDLTLTVRSA
jgi:glycine cleavage system transcriptional repressor